MATATAGLLYGAYEVTRRYVIPNILPEAKSKLKGTKKKLMINSPKSIQSSMPSKRSKLSLGKRKAKH